VSPPIQWAAPSALGVTLRVGQFVTGAIVARNGREVLHRTKRKQWVPNRAYHLSSVSNCRDLAFNP
jgi:hypothetical protein